jgi:hypothetical protein
LPAQPPHRTRYFGPVVNSPQLRPERKLTAAASAFPSKLAFAFDIDGVLKQGKYVLPQAKRVMQLLTGRDGRLPE